MYLERFIALDKASHVWDEEAMKDYSFREAVDCAAWQGYDDLADKGEAIIRDMVAAGRDFLDGDRDGTAIHRGLHLPH